MPNGAQSFEITIQIDLNVFASFYNPCCPLTIVIFYVNASDVSCSFPFLQLDFKVFDVSSSNELYLHHIISIDVINVIKVAYPTIDFVDV